MKTAGTALIFTLSVGWYYRYRRENSIVAVSEESYPLKQISTKYVESGPIYILNMTGSYEKLGSTSRPKVVESSV